MENRIQPGQRFQKQLFEQNYEDFMRTVAKENEKELMSYLKMDEDNTNEEVESALNYLKLRKVKRMLLENQADLEKPHTAGRISACFIKHIEHLKKMEMELTKKMGTVIIQVEFIILLVT